MTEMEAQEICTKLENWEYRLGIVLGKTGTNSPTGDNIQLPDVCKIVDEMEKLRLEVKEIREKALVKIPVKFRVTAYLVGASFCGAKRAYVAESKDGEIIGHEYTVEDFSIEVPQKLMDMLNAETFLAIEVKGEKDFLTDDVSEETKVVAWRS